MVRAREHVDLLHSQYEGLMESIADLEEDLAKAGGHSYMLYGSLADLPIFSNRNISQR